jgi:lysozyme family protein
MKLEEILDGIILSEGSEYTDDPSDSGGPTKYGITIAALSYYRGHKCSKEDVEALEEPEAREIFKERYYHLPHFDKLPEPLQAVVTDAGVLSGPEKATEWLQEVMDMSGFVCSQDGILGPQTLRQAKAAYDAMQSLCLMVT